MSKMCASEKVDQKLPSAPYRAEKRCKFFYTLQYFGAPGGPPHVLKVTNLGDDV